MDRYVFRISKHEVVVGGHRNFLVYHFGNDGGFFSAVAARWLVGRAVFFMGDVYGLFECRRLVQNVSHARGDRACRMHDGRDAVSRWFVCWTIWSAV